MDSLLLLIGTTIAVLGSPGPAPLALAATGAGFGPKRGASFLLGVLVGLAAVAILTAVGAGAVLSRGGALPTVLLVISLAYFVYVAFKIASVPLNREGKAVGRAPSIADGVVLNLTNPKAYAALAALYSGFGLPIEPVWLGLLATGLLVWIVAAAIDVAWLVAGSFLAPAFASQRFGRLLRVGMALTMLLAVMASVWFALNGQS